MADRATFGATSPRGRGATSNPPNRYERLSFQPDPDWNPEEDIAPTTRFLRDRSQAVISYNDSPDLGLGATLNPYRGCEHGCAYCYARRTHDYLGFSSGLDFETNILVKQDAPELLRRELSSPRWRPQPIGLSGVTDAYQPVERRLQLTRRCLQVLAEFRNPVNIVTKNHLVTRDVDILRELAAHHAIAVCLSITSLDASLAQRLEPRASLPKHRLAAVEHLANAGVPVGVLVAPIVPGLTDHETPAILAAAAQTGAQWAGYQIVRLPETVAPVFEQWLARHVPEKMAKILQRIRSMRRGKLNDPRFHARMRGEGIFAEQIRDVFAVARRKAGLSEDGPELSTAAFRAAAGAQLELALRPTNGSALSTAG